MSDSEVHKRLLALRGKLLDEKELHALDISIESAKCAYNLYKASNWYTSKNVCCNDDSQVIYSLNKKYQLSMCIDKLVYYIKAGTQIVFGQGSKGSTSCVPLLSFLLIPDSVQVIMKNAFYGCKNLQNVILGKGLKIIQEKAFADCKLKFIALPEGIYSLGNEVFANNIELESVYIPYTLQRVGVDIFKGCTKLSTIYIDKDFKDKVHEMFPKVKVHIEVRDYRTWDEYNFKRALERSYFLREKPCWDKNSDDYTDYTEDMERRKDFSDEENWHGLTDGMYGDYPTDIY